MCVENEVTNDDVQNNGNAKKARPKSVWEAINMIKGKKFRCPLSNANKLPRKFKIKNLQLEKVEDFMSEELLATNDPNAVYMEGFLWKYQPGFSQHFYQKYCVITPQGFQYFNNPIESSSCSNKPLMFIPLNKIASVMHVSVSIPEEKQIIAQNLRSPQNKPLALPKYQMELFIKGDGCEIAGFFTKDNRVDNARKLLTSTPNLVTESNGAKYQS